MRKKHLSMTAVVLSACMAALLLSPSGMTVSADGTESGESESESESKTETTSTDYTVAKDETLNSTATVDVNYTDYGTFTVTIPKQIELDSTGKGDYTVSVSGDIIGGRYIYVTPVDKIDTSDGINVYLKDSVGKDDITATVTQTKNVWTSSDVTDGTKSATGSITAANISAGEWEGVLEFNILYTSTAPETASASSTDS
jgi:hypothetical protein